MGGFCWPSESSLKGHVMRLLTGPGTHGTCPWCPQTVGRKAILGVSNAAVPGQHTAALCGFRDGNARLTVPGGVGFLLFFWHQMDLAVPSSDSAVFLSALC